MTMTAIDSEVTEFNDEAEISKGKILEPVIYKFIIMLGNALGNGEYEKFCNLVKFLLKTFPYDNKEYKDAIKRAQSNYSVALATNQRTKTNKVQDLQIDLDHAMEIYGILSNLFKDKNMFPRPAEHGEIK